MKIHCLACGPLVIAFLVLTPRTLRAQAGFDDDRVMLQGFYWESYRHGEPVFPSYGGKRWYQIVKESAQTIKTARFDMIWLPPPSHAGSQSAGYNPTQLWKLDNSYGSRSLHRAMLETLLHNGVEPLADVVINHRNGNTKWADFVNPDWGAWAITRDDEAFSDKRSEVYNTPIEQRGRPEERPVEYTRHGGTTYGYESFRDIDHTNPQVRRDLYKYLLQLRSFGYRGWRYDMVHGYHAKWLAQFNMRSQPTFSVGEYDWDKQPEQRGWVWWTALNKDALGPDHLKTSSSVFDFSTQFALKGNKGKYLNWYGLGNGLGLVGDTTDGLPWKQRAVTFLENHDTGYRTNTDGTPQRGYELDSFSNGWEVEQGYAYILTHPGVPSVYWKHYFDWGAQLQSRLKALINARKAAGVHAGSSLHTQDTAKQKGVYGARIEGKKGDLFVRVGGTDADWQPSNSGFQGYREYATGEGWRVWVRLPGNPEVRQVELAQPLPVPIYQEPWSINVPGEWLN